MGKVQSSRHKGSSGTNSKSGKAKNVDDLGYFGPHGKRKKKKKHIIRKSEKKRDEAKEKRINDKCRNINQYHRSPEQTTYIRI